MNIREKGFLLLSSRLGDPHRRALSVHQLRELTRCVLRSEPPSQDRELRQEDLIALGCGADLAERVVSLLSDTSLLEAYLRQGREWGCEPLSRISAGYPLRMKKCLDLDAPGCIWVKGNKELLNKPAVSLVGSRNLLSQNRQFAAKVGSLAARHGLVLISGNARGADSVAQESCLGAGGSVISVVSDHLGYKKPMERILYISEDGFDCPFSNHRALSRNRLIHTMGQAIFVAQCSNGTGGTWDGTCRNLKSHWSPVYCMPDGSAAVVKLYKMGARLSGLVELDEIFKELCRDVG